MRCSVLSTGGKKSSKVHLERKGQGQECSVMYKPRVETNYAIVYRIFTLDIGYNVIRREKHEVGKPVLYFTYT